MLNEVSRVAIHSNGKQSLPQRAPTAHTKECAHVLVPVSLAPHERSAVMLGLETAAAQGAKVTLLRIMPVPDRGNSLHWLDAIEQLHQTSPRVPASSSPGDSLAAFETARAEIDEYLERHIPLSLRSNVDLRTECRVGDAPSLIARFADESAVDLIVMTAEPSSRWLPIFPSPVRRLLQLTKTRVALVIPDARDRTPRPTVPAGR